MSIAMESGRSLYRRTNTSHSLHRNKTISISGHPKQTIADPIPHTAFSQLKQAGNLWSQRFFRSRHLLQAETFRNDEELPPTPEPVVAVGAPPPLPIAPPLALPTPPPPPPPSPPRSTPFSPAADATVADALDPVGGECTCSSFLLRRLFPADATDPDDVGLSDWGLIIGSVVVMVLELAKFLSAGYCSSPRPLPPPPAPGPR